MGMQQFARDLHWRTLCLRWVEALEPATIRDRDPGLQALPHRIGARGWARGSARRAPTLERLETERAAHVPQGLEATGCVARLVGPSGALQCRQSWLEA
jgi:hypothetical protein